MLQYLNKRIVWKENDKAYDGAISESVIATWFGFRQSYVKSKEAGGILLGRYYPDSHTILVDDLTTPMFRDKRTRTTFFRSKSHDKALKKYWKDTNGYGGLLGLWHTHPEQKPNLSNTDLNDLASQFTESKYLSNRVLYVIVGITHIGFWIAYSQNSKIFLGYLPFTIELDT